MRRLTSFVAVLMLLLTAAPIMACVTEQSMTREEQACCRMMKNQCGQMEMPASHGCCQTDIRAAHHEAVLTQSADLHQTVGPVTQLSITDLWSPRLASANRVTQSEPSLPQSPPGSISVLRI